MPIAWRRAGAADGSPSRVRSTEDFFALAERAPEPAFFGTWRQRRSDPSPPAMNKQQPPRPGPAGGDRAAIVLGLARRLRIPSLTERHDSTVVMGLFAFVNELIAIGAMAAVAFTTGEPFVFPSLGPTAFLVFYTPLLPLLRRETRSWGTSSALPPATCPSSPLGSRTRHRRSRPASPVGE